ncbi:hypothetical protein ACO0LF_27590 [Undibacterium sp. Di27W]|uniref:hypothetical protein n=1 Tax=Undibacterium sp. Di27W TaxID=3413036 RepID=UPI003BF2B15D
MGFKLKLDPAFTPFEDSGFSPCTLHELEGCGFDIFYEAAADLLEEDEELAAVVDGRDYCISLMWSSSLKDLACVMIVSTALAKYFDAIISYEGDEPESLEELLANTNAALEDADNENPDEYPDSENASPPTGNANDYDIDALLAHSNYHFLHRQRMMLMDLWANGKITKKQQSDLNKIELALHNLKKS